MAERILTFTLTEDEYDLVQEALDEEEYVRLHSGDEECETSGKSVEDLQEKLHQQYIRQEGELV